MIRAATAKDLTELARIHVTCFTEYWNEAAIAELMETPGVIALVAPHGFVLARAAGDEAEVLTLAVEPPARRKGLGAALVAHACAQAHKLGARVMFLEVGHANATARKLYDRLGFEEVGTRKAYYSGTEDALVLRAQLPVGKIENLD